MFGLHRPWPAPRVLRHRQTRSLGGDPTPPERVVRVMRKCSSSIQICECFSDRQEMVYGRQERVPFEADVSLLPPAPTREYRAIRVATTNMILVTAAVSKLYTLPEI